LGINPSFDSFVMDSNGGFVSADADELDVVAAAAAHLKVTSPAHRK